MLREFHGSNFFQFCGVSDPKGTTFKFNYLCELRLNFKKLGYVSGAYGVTHEKTCGKNFMLLVWPRTVLMCQCHLCLSVKIVCDMCGVKSMRWVQGVRENVQDEAVGLQHGPRADGNSQSYIKGHYPK
jgi:hypothetical protein